MVLTSCFSFLTFTSILYVVSFCRVWMFSHWGRNCHMYKCKLGICNPEMYCWLSCFQSLRGLFCGFFWISDGRFIKEKSKSSLTSWLLSTPSPLQTWSAVWESRETSRKVNRKKCDVCSQNIYHISLSLCCQIHPTGFTTLLLVSRVESLWRLTVTLRRQSLRTS